MPRRALLVGVLSVAFISGAGAQAVKPAGATRFMRTRDSTSTGAVAVSPIVATQVARPVDSIATSHRPSIPAIVFGAIVGGAAGFAAGGLLAPKAHCDACATLSSTLNKYFFWGATTGVVTGGAFGWYVSARH